MSFLIVEDDDDGRELMELLLQTKGYVTLTAATGEEAIEQLAVHPLPDVVLLDLSLPRMSGEAVMTNLNLRGDRGTIKVIVASGWGDLDARATAMGADGYVRKPISLQHLLALVTRLTAGS